MVAASATPHLTSGLVLLVEDPLAGFSPRFPTSPRLRGACRKPHHCRSASDRQPGSERMTPDLKTLSESLQVIEGVHPRQPTPLGHGNASLKRTASRRESNALYSTASAHQPRTVKRGTTAVGLVIMSNLCSSGWPRCYHPLPNDAAVIPDGCVFLTDQHSPASCSCCGPMSPGGTSRRRSGLLRCHICLRRLRTPF